MASEKQIAQKRVAFVGITIILVLTIIFLSVFFGLDPKPVGNPIENTNMPTPTPMVFISNIILPENTVSFFYLKDVQKGHRVQISISTTDGVFTSEIGFPAGFAVSPTYSAITYNSTHIHDFLAENEGNYIIKISKSYSHPRGSISCIVKSSHLIEDATPNSFSGVIGGEEITVLKIVGVKKDELLFMSTSNFNMTILCVLNNPENQLVFSNHVRELGFTHWAPSTGDYFLELSRSNVSGSNDFTDYIPFWLESSNQIVLVEKKTAG